MTIAALIQETCLRVPSRVALRYGNQSWTYADLDGLVNRLAAGLAARGIRPGDRVALLLPNGPETVFADLACLRLGAVTVPLNARLQGPELAYILQHCKARLCITNGELSQLLAPVREELSELEALCVVGAKRSSGSESFARLFDGGNSFDPVTLPPDAPAAILYTSGTTSKPKGATHTQRSLLSAAKNFVQTVGMTESDVVFGMLSMAHVFGFTLQLLSPLSAGATVVVAPRFDPESVLGLIAGHRVTHLYGLPVMFAALSLHPSAEKTDLSSLRYCLAGGDSVTAELSARMKLALGVELYEGCGMTEVIPYTLNRPAIENRVGSIGQPSLGMHIRLVDEAGFDVPDGESGEVWVRSDALMAGYWQDPAATAQVMCDGWFRTGDIARRDRDGYHWFMGRSKEIIKRGGSKVSPLEIEDVLSLCHGVREVAVVGKADAALGERVMAFVVLDRGVEADAAALRNFAVARMARYKVPELYAFLPELPRGATGKVHRKTLKDWATKGSIPSIEIAEAAN